ncbi:hypothetical protein FEM48_Zijuj01G0278900 [Ziziphus jujuba var. spinosa]|uniref:Transcription factor MYB26-like n=1 Tax=Ziziphus jujuba var. spinosa TaxID=714518 RepID=A0A978W5B6_ZIZJJ|nr:hypothetical protein FEM48_Zijuj01G0278900 [Ziziphus jujuba var. spinosa]
MGHHSCCNKQKVKRGLWSPEEDEKLINYISTYGHGCWSSVPKLAGRTDNEVKNFWNSSIKKKLMAHEAAHHHLVPSLAAASISDHIHNPSCSDHHEAAAAAFFTFNPNHPDFINLTSSHHQLQDQQQLYLSINQTLRNINPQHQGLLCQNINNDDANDQLQFAPSLSNSSSNPFSSSWSTLGCQLPTPIQQDHHQNFFCINNEASPPNYVGGGGGDKEMMDIPSVAFSSCENPLMAASIMDGNNCKVMTAYSSCTPSHDHHQLDPPCNIPSTGSYLQDSFVPNTNNNQMDYIEAIVSSLPSSSSSSTSSSSSSSSSALSHLPSSCQFFSNPNLLIPSRWDA